MREGYSINRYWNRVRFRPREEKKRQLGPKIRHFPIIAKSPLTFLSQDGFLIGRALCVRNEWENISHSFKIWKEFVSGRDKRKSGKTLEKCFRPRGTRCQVGYAARDLNFFPSIEISLGLHEEPNRPNLKVGFYGQDLNLKAWIEICFGLHERKWKIQSPQEHDPS